MLLALVLLLSAGISVGACICINVQNLLVIPLFLLFWAVAAVLTVALYLLFVYLLSLFIDPSPEKQKKHPVMMFFLRITLRAVCLGGRAHLHKVGFENLPDQPFLVVSNHLSMLDPVVTVAAMPGRDLCFIAKPEILHFPLIGRVARCCNFLVIDRGNARNAIRTVNQAASLLKNGVCSVGVYPEGTRNRKHEQPLLPFHDGVLMVAQKANAPIVVLALEGTETICPHFPLHRSDVTLTVCEVLSGEQVSSMRTSELSAHVRESLLQIVK